MTKKLDKNSIDFDRESHTRLNIELEITNLVWGWITAISVFKQDCFWKMFLQLGYIYLIVFIAC